MLNIVKYPTKNIMQKRITMIRFIIGLILGLFIMDYIYPTPVVYIKGSNDLVQTLIDRRNFNFEVCFKHPREQVKDQEHYCSVYNELDVILHDLKGK